MIYLLNHLVENSADRFPDREAFRHSEESISYEQLDTGTNQLANVLIDNGLKKGDRVGIYMHRCIETAIAVFGIIKAGAAFVPLDPTAPPARTRFVIEDCGIDILVTVPLQQTSIENVLSRDVNLECVIGLDRPCSERTVSWEEVGEGSNYKPDIRAVDSDLAYVMYTSGTTGLPKGIMHTHRSGLSYAKLSRSLYGVTHKDKLANHSPLHFDISTMGYFTLPLAGGTTVIVPEAHVKFPSSLAGLLEKDRPTIWYSVPLALIQLVRAGGLGDRNLESLRWVLFGGEPFPLNHLRALMEYLPHAMFSNVYGPAEVNQCTYFNFSDPPADSSPVPLGRIWENTEAVLLDQKDNVIEDGGTGELLVSSATMMKGYWGQPELTEKALYRIETAPGLEKIYYRTGDMVRRHENGDLMFVGRKDRQIKLRGYRIELDEIESVLYSHPAVAEAGVVSVRDSANNASIAASVVAKQPGVLSSEALLNYAKDRLPRYVVVDKLEIADSLPRTKAGKIDHTELEKRTTGNLNA